MASTLRVQAEHERPDNRIPPLRARRKMAEALEAAMPQFDAQESKVLPPNSLEHVAVTAVRAASLGKSINKLNGDLTTLSCLLSTRQRRADRCR